MREDQVAQLDPSRTSMAADPEGGKLIVGAICGNRLFRDGFVLSEASQIAKILSRLTEVRLSGSAYVRGKIAIRELVCDLLRYYRGAGPITY